MKNGNLRIYSLFGVFVAAFLLSFVVIGKSHAVLITESMIFMGDKESSAVFKLKNTSKEPRAYRIEWINLRMNPSGSKDAVPDGQAIANVMPAEDFVYVAPRRIVVQPGQLQHIRFMLRRNRDMAEGEYRSYVTVQPENMPAAYKAGANGAQQAKAGQGAAATMNVLAGYRIPLFFLHGETTLDLQFTDVRRGTDKAGNPALLFTAIRSGNRSALGQAELVCRMPGGERVVLASQRIQIFTELDRRQYRVYDKTPPAGCTNTALEFFPHEGDPLYQRNVPFFVTPL